MQCIDDFSSPGDRPCHGVLVKGNVLATESFHSITFEQARNVTITGNAVEALTFGRKCPIRAPAGSIVWGNTGDCGKGAF
jgi:hypothetical protein